MKIVPTRRRFLSVLAAPRRSPRAAAPGQAARPSAWSRRLLLAFRSTAAARLLQVLAHPDDELYFMNPDTVQLVEAGVPVVSVYVTAGEALGQPSAGAPLSGSRQGRLLRRPPPGLRYAAMLGTDIFTPWRRGTMRLAHGMSAEVDVRRAGLPRRGTLSPRSRRTISLLPLCALISGGRDPDPPHPGAVRWMTVSNRGDQVTHQPHLRVRGS